MVYDELCKGYRPEARGYVIIPLVRCPLHLRVQKTTKQLTISISSHRGSFDRPACLQTKKIPGEGSLHNCT